MKASLEAEENTEDRRASLEAEEEREDRKASLETEGKKERRELEVHEAQIEVEVEERRAIEES